MEVIELSQQNKKSLLDRTCQEILKQRDQAEAILARLHDLNPELAAHFRLKEIALLEFPIRLLCSPGAYVRSYLVISYCWRGSDWQPVDDSAAAPWPLCEPMVKEIQKLRISDDEGIWIDVPCIAQDNEAEKKAAVGSMDVVYLAARRLLIVLEDIQLNEVEQAVMKKYDGIFQELVDPDVDDTIFKRLMQRFDPSEAEYTVVIQSLQKILSARWFGRTWCNHEIRIQPMRSKTDATLFLMFGNAREVICLEHRFLYMLSHCIAFEDANDDRRSMTFPPSTRSMPLSLLDNADMSMPFLAYRFSRMIGGRQNTPSPPMATWLGIIGSVCREPSDLVSIVMNLGRICLSFSGTSETTDYSCWILIALTVAAGDVSPLLLQGRKLSLRGTHGLARSWAQEPRTHGERYTPDASHITAISPDFIELDLLLIQGTPKYPSTGVLEAAHAIISRSRLDTLAREMDTPARFQFLRGGVLGNKGVVGGQWLDHFLASALECGLDWIRQFASVLEGQISTEEWWLGKLPQPDARFEGVAVDILAYFEVRPDELPDCASQYVEPVTQFVACMMDIRFRGILPTPRHIRTGIGSHYALTEITWSSVWFAVPVSLKNTSFHSNRVWLVEPFDPEEPWISLPKFRDGYASEASSVDPRKFDEHKLEPIGSNGFLGFHPSIGESPATVVLQRTCKTFDTADLRASRSGKASWRLIEKTTLVGCGAIVECKDVVQLLQRQKVYG